MSQKKLEEINRLEQALKPAQGFHLQAPLPLNVHLKLAAKLAKLKKEINRGT